MLLYFFLVSAFPALAIDFGMGNVPSRYLALAVIPWIKALAKIDLILLVLVFVHAFYVIAAMPVRPLHLLDVSYLLGYIYVIVGLQLVRENPEGFRRFVYYFWLANILYATVQNIILIAGLDQTYALFHQNVHSEEYVVPVVHLMPELFRVTGLFVESAPFVLYLIVTHFAFSIMRFPLSIRSINVLIILLAGAKVGYLFVLLLLVNPVLTRFRVNVLIPLVASMGVILMVAPMIMDYVNEHSGLGLSSIHLRLEPLYNLLAVFSENTYGMLFGYGFISSTELMAGEFEGMQRGIDFFSTYIVANGVIGSAIILTPLYLWFRWNLVDISLKDKNLLTITLVLALLSMGSLLNFQYAYLLFVVACSGSSQHEVFELQTIKERYFGK